jgi:hypothetical protein
MILAEPNGLADKIDLKTGASSPLRKTTGASNKAPNARVRSMIVNRPKSASRTSQLMKLPSHRSTGTIQFSG